jgi:hypothetical protein
MTPKQQKLAIIGGIILVVLLVFVVWPLSSLSSTKTQGVDKETALSAQYRDAQNYLSSYINGFYEKTGLVISQKKAMNDILLAAVQGRYQGKMTPGTSGSLFSAITEAYPNLDGLSNSYKDIQNYISGGRAGFRDKQSALLDQLRNYDKWRNSGLFHPMWVSMAGFPSSNLEARVNGQPVLTGKAAEEKMKQLVLSGDATTSYQTGTDKALTVPSG